MKKMKKFLLLSAVLTAAVCAQAQQRVVAHAGQDYTIEDAMSASGNSVTYQWFRDGVAISGATGATYTVPANLAKMEGATIYTSNGAKFQRAAYGIDCMGGVAMSNTVTIYFCDLMVNGICWARANSDVNGRINLNPYDRGDFFQWNKLVGYNPTTANAAVSGWSAAADNAATWTNGYPCPPGWRLPTAQDIENLFAIGSVWVAGGLRGVPAGTSGKFFGYNTDYCTISNMVGCVFIPTSGFIATNGVFSPGPTFGYYWSGESYASTTGRILRVGADANMVYYTNAKNNAFSIRCVIDVN